MQLNNIMKLRTRTRFYDCLWCNYSYIWNKKVNFNILPIYI